VTAAEGRGVGVVVVRTVGLGREDGLRLGSASAGVAAVGAAGTAGVAVGLRLVGRVVGMTVSTGLLGPTELKASWLGVTAEVAAARGVPLELQLATPSENRHSAGSHRERIMTQYAFSSAPDGHTRTGPV
jgi:hypothetical protein